MSVLMKRLEKLTEFETKLLGYDKEIQKAKDNPQTTIATIGALMKKAEETAGEFNQWMSKEFGFGGGPQIMPTILKTVLEKTLEPSRIVMP